MKLSFVNKAKEFRKEYLICRDKQKIRKKWLNEYQKEAYIYDDWIIETPTGLYDKFTEGYYENMRGMFKKGYKIDYIKEYFQNRLIKAKNEMNKRLKRDGIFHYEDNEMLIYDFAYLVFIITKMRAIKSSDNFGIMKTGKKPMEVIYIY